MVLSLYSSFQNQNNFATSTLLNQEPHKKHLPMPFLHFDMQIPLLSGLACIYMLVNDKLLFDAGLLN